MPTKPRPTLIAPGPDAHDDRALRSLRLRGLACRNRIRCLIESCVANLRKQAIKSGVSSSVAKRALSGVKFDEKVIRFLKVPAGVPHANLGLHGLPRRSATDCRWQGHDGQRHDRTLCVLSRRATALTATSSQPCGASRATTAAIAVISSCPMHLANLVCAGRKSKFFRRELFEALQDRFTRRRAV